MSFSTIIAYGYALGGLGSYAMGVPKPLPIAAGLIGGTFCAYLALKIWRLYLAEIEAENRRMEEAREGDHEEDL
ncbi:hypothetical protein [uncultured Cloacibacillus sp.]|uniref:hypothetical protein n=1 Tax=Cloacibacillus porcorum TaxID=1197717 RepID=UPI002588BF95|nr:hypothetical protein [uncultured Cloacibacillus sp.]